LTPSRPRFARARALLALAVSAVSLPSLAQTWIAGDGNWSDAANWNPATVPTTSGIVTFSNADAAARTLTYDYTGPTVKLSSISIDQRGTGTNTLSIDADTLSVTSMYVGQQGRGVVNQTGGNVTVGSGTLNFGVFGGGSGVYNLTGGSLTTESVATSKGDGTFNHSGGTHTVNATLDLSGFGPAGATYNLSGSGTLTTKDLKIGRNTSRGLFDQRGGTATVTGTLTLYSNTNAAYFLQDGSLTAAATVNDARFTQTGGTASLGTLSGLGQTSVARGGALSATAIRQASLTLESGATVSITSGGGDNGTSKLSQLSLASDVRFDLADHALVLDYTGASPIGTIRAAVAAGTLTSSLAGPTAVLGYAEAADVLSPTGGTFAGQSADGTAVLVRLTRPGDANLDGTVNFADLLALARNYNRTGVDWNLGDFNYDGTVNFADLLALAKNYNATAPADPLPGARAAFTADLAAAFAAVPEPSLATLGFAACGFALTARRRRPNSAAL
jgi:hypothetical protein